MNSLISKRMSMSSESNKNEARALVSSVLPTPVGPKNMKEPYGRLGSDNPALDLRIASDTALIASC